MRNRTPKSNLLLWEDIAANELEETTVVISGLQLALWAPSSREATVEVGSQLNSV